MRRALLLTTLLLAIVPAAARAEDPQLIDTTQLAPRLQQLTFKTSALAAPTRVRVLLPSNYDASGKTRYPELLLLHGAGDNEAAWTDKGDVVDITKDFPGIVVMPDGGTFGLYTDWYNGGKSGPPAYETFQINELTPWIDAHYPTVGTRAGRAIAGLSMGGGGAMTYAAKHPDLFVAAASFSGQLDTNNSGSQTLIANAGTLNGMPGSEPFGPRAQQEIRWRGQNATDLAANLADTAVTVRTGNGQPGGGAPAELLPDPLESTVHDESQSFHQRLLDLKIAHTYDDYGKGTHTWFYWQRDLRQLLPDLEQVFKENRPNPAVFTYTTIAPSYSVYGWDVSIKRPALEFSTLTGAGAGGFALSGSGTAHVTTGPIYKPGQALSLIVSAADNASGRAVTADAQGRLGVDVDLGPGNPFQQFSPQATAALTSGGSKNGITLTPDAKAYPVYTATVEIAPVSSTCKRGAKRVARIGLRGIPASRVRRVTISASGQKRRVLYGPRSVVRVPLKKRSLIRVRVTLRSGRTITIARVLRGKTTCT